MKLSTAPAFHKAVGLIIGSFVGTWDLRVFLLLFPVHRSHTWSQHTMICHDFITDQEKFTVHYILAPVMFPRGEIRDEAIGAVGIRTYD